MTEELKPCPFCGGEAEIIKSHGQKIDTRTMPYRVALAVVCKNVECGANMGNWYERAEAVAAWNRRAQPAAVFYKDDFFEWRGPQEAGTVKGEK